MPFSPLTTFPRFSSFEPIGFEGFEGSIIDGLSAKGRPNLDLLPEGGGILLVEFGSDDAASMRRLARATHGPAESKCRIRRTMRLYTQSEARIVWKLRETGPRAAAFAPGAPPQWEGWDDAAVAPEKVGGYLRDIRKLLDEYSYHGAFYGHFGHGCIHMRVTFDLESEAGIRNYGEFVERAADLVVSYGGSLSGEHGDGQSRGALLPKMFGPELMKAFREFKAVWDPRNKNESAQGCRRLSADGKSAAGCGLQTVTTGNAFQIPGRRRLVREVPRSDASAWARAARRDSGSMCPSYMVTLEEEHSTRGRAHMLFEMLQGEVIDGAGRTSK